MNVTFILKEHQTDKIFVIGHQPNLSSSQKKPLPSPKATVRCGLSGNRIYIYGPYKYFFENSNTMEAQTINRVTNLKMQKRSVTHPDEWFQQDGATAHTAGEYY